MKIILPYLFKQLGIIAGNYWTSLVICVGLLLVGLFPLNFHSKNNVFWLRNENGIGFNKDIRASKLYNPGIVYNQNILHIPPDVFKNNSITLEIWLKTNIVSNYQLSYILSFYDGKIPESLIIGQWKSSLVVRIRKDTPHNPKVYREIGLENILAVGEKQFLTLTSDDRGTDIYVNGVLYKSYPDVNMFYSKDNLSGQLILGVDSSGENAWSGNIYGIALYDQQHSPEIVHRHFQQWKQRDMPQLLNEEDIIALYSFDENEGEWAYNQADRNNNHLFVAPHFKIPRKSILSFSLHDIDFKSENVKDVIINILGFTPFGFCFLSILSKKKHFFRINLIFITILLGGLISLTIELLQIYLPSRNSSLLDLICNIAGTAVGVILLFLYLNSDRSRFFTLRK